MDGLNLQQSIARIPYTALSWESETLQTGRCRTTREIYSIATDYKILRKDVIGIAIRGMISLREGRMEH